MPQEVALFWLVLAGFWLFDNLVQAPPEGDLLRLDRQGRPQYLVASRFAWRRRDALWRNPLDPFDFVVPSTRLAGAAAAPGWRRARRRLRQATPTLRALGWLGLAYQAVLLLLLGLSWQWHFGGVLALLLAWHFLAWCTAVLLLLRGRERLHLGREALVGLLAEALFVPAYTLGLGKRAARRLVVDLPSLALGLRTWQRLPDDGPRERLGWQLSNRLEALLLDHGVGPDAGGSAGALAAEPAKPPQSSVPWALAARRCLQRHD